MMGYMGSGGRGMMGYTGSASCDKGDNSKQIKLTDHLKQAVPLLTDVSVINMCFQNDTVYMLYIVCMRVLTFNKQIIKQDFVLPLASILPQVHKESHIELCLIKSTNVQNRSILKYVNTVNI